MADLDGFAQLQARFRALQGTQKMRYLGEQAIGEMRRNIPRKTSTTSRSLHLERLTETSARITGSPVAWWLDRGTGLYGPHRQRITPAAAKALRWYSGALRLSGRPRISQGVSQGTAVFARSVAGMRGRPYIARSLRATASKLGVGIVDTWNGAA